MIRPLKRLAGRANSGTSKTSKPLADEKDTPAVEALKAFLSILNRGAMDELSQLFEQDADVVFVDAHMGVAEYAEEMVRACKAFPDLSFEWVSVEDLGQDKAILRGLRAQGTHQGPYGFGPYPTIEATQIKCKNDPEEVTLWINPATGKVRKALFVPKGELTGPPGFYTQIGGLIF